MNTLTVSLPTDEGLAAEIGEIPGVRFVTWDLDGPAPAPSLDIVVPPYWGGNRRLAQLGHTPVRLVQWQSIGFNGLAKHLPPGVPAANASTVHETSTAELALALTLAAQRGLPGFVRQADAQRWHLESFPSLADRRVLLIGYGGVSKAIEARLSGFEVQITRLARTARTDTNLAGAAVPVLGMSELHAALTAAEVVIVAVPLTSETQHLIDAAALAALPDGALLVNVARGPVVDTEALVSELQSGRLRAALDVTDPEPLPADHALWQCPNVLVTPHAGGDSSAMLPRMAALIRRQIDALQQHRTPENIVIGEWSTP